MKDKVINLNDGVKCCAQCVNFKSEGPTHDQPYPELWCSSGHWEGLSESYDEIYGKIDCVDFDLIPF